MAYGDDPVVETPATVAAVAAPVVSGYGKDPVISGYGKDPVASAPKESSIYEDEPGRYYGALLPFSEDETTHEKRWGLGENSIVRSLARGMRDMGGRLTGPLTPDKLRGLNSDEQAAYMTFGGLPTKFGAGDPRRMGTNPDIRPVKPTTPEPLIGGITREQALAIADDASKNAVPESKVNKRINQDISAEGRRPEDIVAEMERGRQLGKPVALVDVAGSNTRGLAGTVARQPGESKATFDQFFERRDSTVGERTQADVAKYIAQGPTARRTVQGLQQHQVQEAEPLYKKAFEGGSIAPLEQQFTAAFDTVSKAEKDAGRALTVAQNRLTAAQGKSSQAGNVYSTSGANQLVREAQAGVAQAESELAAVQGQKQQILDVLRQTQEDASLNRPGAVWNPRIQQFLDDPITKAGLQRGIEVQRLEALAKGQRFDPTEYAIVGENNGEHIIAKVPNMRTLDAVKKGLDAIIQDSRGQDGRLTQRGRAVDQVRRSLLKELDDINGDYKAARASWQGDAASMDAVKFGKNVNKYSPEEVRDFVADRSASDKDFLRLGVADNILERIARTSYGGDEAKHMIKSEWAKGQLKPIFRNEGDFRNFVDSVAMERLMFDTKTLVRGNSATAERTAEDTANVQAGMSAVRGVGHAITGHVIPTMVSAWHTMKYLGLRPKPAFNTAMAKILTDTNIDLHVGKNGKLVVSPRVPLLDDKGQLLPREKLPAVPRFMFDRLPEEPPGGFAKGGSVDADMLRHFEDASAETGVPLPHLLSFARLESNFNPSAVSPTGARGIMQVLPSTAAKPGFGVEGIDPETLFDAKTNIGFGAKYAAALAKQTGLKDWNDLDQLSKVLQRYSGGADPNYNSNFSKHLASYGGIQARPREELPVESAAAPEELPDDAPIQLAAAATEEPTTQEDTILGIPTYVWNVLDKTYKERLVNAAVQSGALSSEQAKRLLGNQQSFAEGGSVNDKYVRSGEHTYNALLKPFEEKVFRKWLQDNEVPFDAEAGVTDYDMRGFWKALVSKDPKAATAIDPHDQRIHYPDYWKTPMHETFSRESQWATPDAPQWTDDGRLIDIEGKVLFSPQKYAEGGLVQTTPEPQADIQAQTESMQNPESTKDSVFIAQGSLYPPDIPIGTIIVRRAEGDLMTTSLEKAAQFLDAENLTDQNMADILGYTEAKPEVVDPVVLQGVEPTGAVSSEMLSSPDKTVDATKAILAQSPGAALRMITPDMAQQRRLAAYVGQA